MPSELKPCPCCGGKAEYKADANFFVSYYVRCTNCGMRTPKEEHAQRVIDIWNKRKEIDPHSFKVKMEKLAEEDSREFRHIFMDDLMCRTLCSLGYNEGVDIFNNTGKWYA